MATEVVMPQLGQSVAEGTVSRWLKQQGEWVEKDEPLVEIMTDKVSAEIPSPAAGRLASIVVAEGEIISVGSTLATIEGRAEAHPNGRAEATSHQHGAAAAAVAAVEEAHHTKVTPVVRRLAQEHQIDLSRVKGTGSGGRVTKDDILSYIRAVPAGQPAPEIGRPETEPIETSHPKHPVAAPVTSPERVAVGDREEAIPVSPMRRMIAEHMVRSRQTSPHAATFTEVDMTRLVRYRERMKEEFARREGISLTYLPFAIRAVIDGLRAFPILNSSWAGDQIILKRYVNIGVAVALDDGLIVPVIHDAGDKSIAGLAREIASLSEKARSGNLSLSDVQGGTFTVNNPGIFGSIFSIPIINQPQAAILTMEAITKRPVVVDDAIAIRSMMYMCLSFDHRITDGAAGAKFLQHVKGWLEGFDPDTAV